MSDRTGTGGMWVSIGVMNHSWPGGARRLGAELARLARRTR